MWEEAHAYVIHGLDAFAGLGVVRLGMWLDSLTDDCPSRFHRPLLATRYAAGPNFAHRAHDWGMLVLFASTFCVCHSVVFAKHAMS